MRTNFFDKFLDLKDNFYKKNKDESSIEGVNKKNRIKILSFLFEKNYILLKYISNIYI